MKPYFQDDAVTIYHGDCREILPTLEAVDLVLTDPPYGIGWNTDYTRFTGERGVNQKYPTVTGDQEPFEPDPWLAFPEVILWGANCYSNKLPQGSWLVWDKRFINGEAFLADAEVAWWSRGHGVYIFSHTWQGSHRHDKERWHPTQKPILLMQWCIEKAHSPSRILDPFMGSGTTLRAAKDLGRKAIGIEIEERYCELAAKRMAQSVMQLEAVT